MQEYRQTIVEFTMVNCLISVLHLPIKYLWKGEIMFYASHSSTEKYIETRLTIFYNICVLTCAIKVILIIVFFFLANLRRKQDKI